jgi:signal transduction histidine kinase
MKLRFLENLSIRQTVRYVEWTLLAIFTLVIILFTLIFPEQTFPSNVPNWLIFIPLSAFVALSFIFPSDRPPWQRRGYVLLEFALLIPDQFFIGWGLDLLLFFLIAKSCFLLNRRDVLITVVLAGIVNNLGFAYTLAAKLEFMRSNIEELYDPKKIIPTSVISNIGFYIAISVFIVLLCSVALSEQKSRRRAEALAYEVETLAATLERTRIARDIHDALGHTLTTLDVQLELAQKLRQRDPEQALQAVDMAKVLASQCLQDVRRALRTMRQPAFDLNQAIATLIEQVQLHQTFVIQATVNVPLLSLSISHQIYCIVQEGLTNIQKHAQATQVTLQIQPESEQLRLELIDNGQGFDPKAATPGFGLKGMAERVQLLAGSLKIQSTPGKGTRIQISIPYSEDIEF